MSRALILGILGLLVLTGAGAQAVLPTWVLTGPQTVKAGETFVVQAKVKLPFGYYQDADSTFLIFEPAFPAEVIARSSSTPSLRVGKVSFTGTFTLTRTLVASEDLEGPLSFTTGWQICKIDGVCLLPVQTTKSLSIGTEPVGVPDFWGALLGAFLGGLILNLMPCVFPVLALKALGIAGSAGLSRSQRRVEALAFSAGSFSTVFALGLILSVLAALGQRLDWGFPFQQPLFVWVLVLAFFALALQLWGVWKPAWTPFVLSGAARKRSLGGSWLSGAFLVLAATPCTAPILGPALGYALSRPAFEIPFFFAAMGLGLTLPLLILMAFPDWSKFLPRPGRWMVVAEQIAGVFLAATVVYLLWILGVQLGADRLWTALVLLVVWGAAVAIRKITLPRKLTALALAAVLVGGSVFLVAAPSTPEKPDLRGWAPFSQSALDEALAAGRPVLIDATAAWCATCQVNELAVLGRPEMTAMLDRLQVVRLRADYTRPDEAIHSWLTSVQRAGLPVYALYRPSKPVYLFPELLDDANFVRTIPRLLTP